MEEEKLKDNNSKVENKMQRKSEKDRNGIIGSLVFGSFFAFLAYQIYIRAFEFPIGKILVYSLVVLSFLCFAVTVSCFFDYKESKKIEKLDEENMGELIYFFEKSCAMSGMILGVNPFNQPGVEEYKKNMFKLLKKPGY